jgi:hypothetical protein
MSTVVKRSSIIKKEMVLADLFEFFKG